MKTYAHIPSRQLTIVGQPNSGWSIADDGTPSSFDLEFQFKVTDAGGRGCLLVYCSLDSQFSGDAWHETLEAALAAAQEEFGIARSEWSELAHK